MFDNVFFSHKSSAQQSLHHQCSKWRPPVTRLRTDLLLRPSGGNGGFLRATNLFLLCISKWTLIVPSVQPAFFSTITITPACRLEAVFFTFLVDEIHHHPRQNLDPMTGCSWRRSGGGGGGAGMSRNEGMNGCTPELQVPSRLEQVFKKRAEAHPTACEQRGYSSWLALELVQEALS